MSLTKKLIPIVFLGVAACSSTPKEVPTTPIEQCSIDLQQIIRSNHKELMNRLDTISPLIMEKGYVESLEYGENRKNIFYFKSPELRNIYITSTYSDNSRTMRIMDGDEEVLMYKVDLKNKAYPYSIKTMSDELKLDNESCETKLDTRLTEYIYLMNIINHTHAALLSVKDI